MSKIKSSFTIEPKRNLTNIVFNWIKFKVDLYIEPIKKMFESQTLINLDEYVDDVVVIHMSKRKDRYKKLRKESKRIKLTDGNMFDKIKSAGRDYLNTDKPVVANTEVSSFESK